MKLYKLENKNINFGIQLLRFLLCFWIVIVHCSPIRVQYRRYLFKGFHVPTFILIAFYFYYSILSKRNIARIKARFQRLLIPYIIWPTLIFILKKIPLKFFQIGKYKSNLALKYLYIQFLLGTSIYGIFWFQYNLLFLSLFFSIISFLFKNNLLLVLQCLCVISLYIHISGIYYIFLISFPNNIGFSLNSLISFMPIAIFGCFLGSINLIHKIKNIPLYLQLILLSFLFLLFKYNIFANVKGFMYSNVFLHISASILLLLLFGSISFDKFGLIKTIIYHISKYTGGIYYIHTLIRDIFLNYINLFKKENYFLSSLIFFICYFICFIGNKLLKNNDLKYLFF